MTPCPALAALAGVPATSSHPMTHKQQGSAVDNKASKWKQMKKTTEDEGGEENGEDDDEEGDGNHKGDSANSQDDNGNQEDDSTHSDSDSANKQQELPTLSSKQIKQAAQKATGLPRGPQKQGPNINNVPHKGWAFFLFFLFFFFYFFCFFNQPWPCWLGFSTDFVIL